MDWFVFWNTYLIKKDTVKYVEASIVEPWGITITASDNNFIATYGTKEDMDTDLTELLTTLNS